MLSMAMEGSALVLGVGALGASAALTLASGGVSRLVLADGDRVEVEDLGWSALLGEADLGAERAQAAAGRLRVLFPGIEVIARPVGLTPANALELVRGASVVLAGMADLHAQFLASDAALRAGVPLVVGGVLRTSAQVLTVRPGGWGGCLRCLFEDPPMTGRVPSARDAGALGPVAMLAGALMGAEALRVLTAEHGAYEGRLLAYEARSARARVVPVPRRADCPACTGAQSLDATGPSTPAEVP
jgi:molybdopterin/thiamine biosynthesis adenylyltransferase